MLTGDVLKAIETFAAKPHEGQKRKYKQEPYIVHSLRVMELCRKYTESTPFTFCRLAA
jgi:guanosine-3',5'-bis(diphosphate) 3'-pyrophosphohydrolase